MDDNNWLKEYKRNVFSQNGEDGIIEKILDILPEKNNWAVEFGAWDGEHLSNTYNLIDNFGYSCVLIEGDIKKYTDLLNLCEIHESIFAVNKFVNSKGDNSLDNILRKTVIRTNFDDLSIEID